MIEDMEVLENEVAAESGSAGADVSDQTDTALDYTESLNLPDHPLLTTNFAEYTVTEGLLLLIFVILLVDFFLNLLRRWF